jgi:iron-sulfur cluster repair protein YtfE (RIC family)
MRDIVLYNLRVGYNVILSGRRTCSSRYSIGIQACIDRVPQQSCAENMFEIKRVLAVMQGKVQEGHHDTVAEKQELLRILGEHNDKEEQILYPAIDQYMSMADRQDVFSRMEQVAEVDDDSGCVTLSQARERAD